MYYIIDEEGLYYAAAADADQLAAALRQLRQDDSPRTRDRSRRIITGGAVAGFWDDGTPIAVWQTINYLERETEEGREHYLDECLRTVQTVQTVHTKKGEHQ